MTRAILIWLFAAVLGVALITWLPEHWLGGKILFRLSDRHGPTLADALGLALVMAGWAVFLRALWLKRRDLEPRWAAGMLGIVAIAAVYGCLAAFSANLDSWGVVLGLISLMAQLLLARLALVKRR